LGRYESVTKFGFVYVMLFTGNTLHGKQIMEIDQSTSATGYPLRAFPLVDYRTCETCGFRLMRVEPSPSQSHPIEVSHCPICGSTYDEKGYTPGKKLTPEERQTSFDAWLASHGLNRSQLENIYRLPMENFFSINLG
jgi:hypothetical protein